MISMKTILLIKVNQKKSNVHIMAVVQIKIIRKEKWISHLFIKQIIQGAFLRIVMSMLSIIILQLYYRKKTKNIYPQEHNLNKKNAVFVVIKMLFWIYY